MTRNKAIEIFRACQTMRKQLRKMQDDLRDSSHEHRLIAMGEAHCESADNEVFAIINHLGIVFTPRLDPNKPIDDQLQENSDAQESK